METQDLYFLHDFALITFRGQNDFGDDDEPAGPPGPDDDEACLERSDELDGNTCTVYRLRASGDGPERYKASKYDPWLCTMVRLCGHTICVGERVAMFAKTI